MGGRGGLPSHIIACGVQGCPALSPLFKQQQLCLGWMSGTLFYGGEESNNFETAVVKPLFLSFLEKSTFLLTSRQGRAQGPAAGSSGQ